MHYIDEGTGDSILFLHGNPTSCYLWRNIIPYLLDKGRCIAPDLIGMGKSDKPRIDYGFFDHYAYLSRFIKELDLENITLVLHDWGSALGFHYAFNNRDKVKAIAFMESIYRTWQWSELRPSMGRVFRMMRTPGLGWLMVALQNGFIKKLLPGAIMRPLETAELDYYSAPYRTLSSRKPLLKWPREVPLGGKPNDVCQAVEEYSNWLKTTTLPLFCLYATPGLLIDRRAVDWIKKHMPSVKFKDVGKGIHFIQEDEPDNIGKALAKWYVEL